MSEEGVLEKYRDWKDEMEAMGLRVIVGNTKMMIFGVSEDCITESVK